MIRLLGSVRRPWMVALFAVLAVGLSVLLVNTAQAAAPVNSAFPSINAFTGYGPTNNRTATVTAGSWTADETPTLSYQWYRCFASGAETTTLPADCYIINNRTNSDYGINQTDVGWYLRVAETATTSGGNVTVYSATTNRVLASRILSSWYTSNCAIKNGGVWCWGNNFNGQLGDNSVNVQRTTPVAVLKSDLTPLTGAVAVATSNTHTCAVTDDKSLWCWGANAAGQLGDGTTTASKTAVKVKASSGVDLTDIVDVAVAGDASNSLQSGFTCAINTSGTLLCWGLNSSGQLGTGNTTSASYPAAVTDMSSGVNQVAVNDKSACAIKNGAAYCWGLNGSGQLGIGNTTNKTTPTAVTTLTSNTTGITMGALSACAIRAGAAFCWGDNVTGNLGTGNTTLSNVPVAAISTADSVPVSLSSGVIDIASNENGSNSPYNTTCFLKESGAVICTGYNQYRQLTNNSNAQSNTPVRSVYYTSNVSEIDMGQYSFCAVMSGAVRCLGATPVAGDGTANSPTTPSNVTGMTGLAPESYSPNVSTSTIAPATYVGTGQSLSSVTPNEMSGYPSPSPSYQWLLCTDNTGGAGASTPAGCSSLAGATASSLTLTADHFGKYLRLQTLVTDGTVTRGFVSASTIASGTPPSPTGTSTYSGTQAAGLIPGLTLTSSTTVTFNGTPTPTASNAWVRCASKVNSDYSSAIDGTLPAGCAVISGATSPTYKLSASDIGFFVSPAQIATTSAGQTIAVSASTDRVRGGQRIAMSANHSCAIKSGLVYCWGINTSGQLGDGTTTSTTKPGLSPVRFSDGSLLTDVIAISISTNHSCALTKDGEAYCWGANTFGQLGNGTTTQQSYPTRVLASSGTPLTEVTTLTAGLKNSCFVKSAQLYCAGANASGQIGKGVAEASTNYLYPLLNSILGTGVQQVVANAEELICAIKSAQAYCWGSYTYSNLGFSSAGNVATPTLLVTPANVVTLSLGKLNGCLVASADLYCWGGGTYGANGTGGSVVVPTLVKAVPKTAVQLTTSIGGNGTFTCLYTINEDVYCAGDNTYYAAPYDIASGGLTVFRKTGTITGIAEIASGDRATCFVVSKTLKCVGSNASGVIGFGSNVASYYPYSPAGMDNYIGSADLAPIVNLSTSGFATITGTLSGKAEDSSGSVTLGFPYPSISKSWNTCTQIGEATGALPGDCSATSSATGDTLVLSSSDSGSKFRYSVTASNSIATVTKTTATIGPVQTAPTTFTSNPSISMLTPAPLVGHPVTAVPSEISTEGRVDHNYQWYRCSASDSSTADSLPSGCTLIPDGTTKSYQVRPEDTGSFLRFSDTAKAGAGDLIKWSPTTTSYVMDGQSVSSNGTSTCAIRQGMVQCWGASGNLQGDGVGAANTAPSRYVSISAGVRLTDVVSVSVGQSAACAITVSGALYCWGPNSTGAIGDGSVVGKAWATPVSSTAGGVAFSSGVMQVSTGISSTCAIKYGGAVYCWGSNVSNVLGNSSLQVNTNYTVPQETTRAAALGISNTGATKVMVGQQHACIIQGGFIYCAGYGGYGQLYNGTNGNNTSFDKFLYTNNFWANGGFTDVAISGNSTCFIQSGGVRCVGQSTNYLNGTTNTTTSDGKLVFNEELWSGSVSISGYKETNGGQVGYCASKLDSNYCWGVNTSGQDWGLTTTPLTTPTKLPVYVKQLALGLGNACGIVDETLSCVGSNTTGALGNGTQVSSATPVSTGITSGVGTYYADPAAVTQTFTGTLASGSVLTGAQKPFTGYPRPTMSYQWYRCLKVGNSVNVLPTDCFAISGATGETYTVTSADLGKRIRYGATGVVGGTTLRNFSAASVAVGVVPVSMNSSVKLIGTTLGTQVGTTFQQSKALFTGTPSPTISYKWLRCTVLGAVVLTSVPVNCREIPGATSISYTTTVADINYMIRGQQIATNEIGSATLITPTTGFINEGDRIAVADGTTCVIKDGAVWCVGAGTRGQLGNGTWVDSNVPVQVKRTVSTNLTNVRHITGAGTHFCAITWNAQAVFCWGSNTYGELGFTAGTDYNYATQVTSVLLTSIVGSLSIGPTSTCATTTNGLICWGNKVNGLLGNGQSTGSQSSSAAPAGFTADANRVSVGATSACGIKLGALFCWGLNTYGQLGDGTTTTRLAPVAVSGAASGVSDVAVGSSATCAVIDGAAKCWGNNDFGQLGNGTNTANGAPTTISNASDGTSFDSGVTDISMSSNSTSPTQDSVCVTKASGAVYCFGYNGEGQLLNGETTSTNVAKPALVATSGVTSVAVGSDHSCFIKNNSAYCSGANTQGQLLDSTTTASATPVNVSTFSSISAFGSSPGAASTAPFIFGNTVKVGKPVQSDPGVVNVSPPPTYTYLWYSCTASSATATTNATVPTGCTVATGPTANTDTYTPVAADKDKYLRMYVGLVQGGTTYPSFTATSAKVLPGEPEITFNPLPGPIIVGGEAVQLTPVSSTGNTVFTYVSSTPTLCSVNSTGLISGVSSGICDIAVTQAAAGAYDTITVTFSAVTGPGEQVITFPQPDPTQMRPGAFTPAVSASSGLPVTLTSSTPAVCTASGTAVTLVSLGTCSISADQAGTSAYYAAPTETRSFEITQGSQTLSLSASNLALTDGTYSLPAASSAGLIPTYATSSSACSVSGTTLNLLTVGTCVVTGSQSGNTNYSAASTVSATFRIVGAPENDSAPTISGDPIFGVTYLSNAGVWVGAGTVTISQQWYSCTSAGDAVVGSGNLGANAPSECTAISGATSATFTPTADQIGKRLRLAELASNVTSSTTNYYSAFTATSAVVAKQSQTVTFGAFSSATFGDANLTLGATSDRGLTISYSSSDTSVCTISGSSLTIVGAGNCDVTASQAGNSGTLAATSVTQSLTVAKASQIITLPNFTAGVYGGAPKASGASSTSGLTVTLTSADTAVCTVSGLNVNQVAPGTCSITASQAGDSNYLAATSVTKSFTIAKATQTITFAPTTKQKPAGDFAAGGSASSGLTVSYSSSTTSVCTVSGSTVSPVGLGTCTIVASQTGDSNYSAATSVTASFTIESVPVQTAAISIASAANYRFGTAIATSAGTWTGTASVTISRAWYRCDTAPSVSAGTGSAAALAPSDCVLISGSTGTSYTPVAADITKFVAVAETASNTTSTGANSRTTFVSTATAVEKQTQTITFAALTAKTFGDAAFALSATSDRSLTITYASSDTSVCTVSGSTLTIVGAGSCDITASQSGNSTTLAATDVVRALTVNKKAQTITLPDFTAGVYGGANKASGATTTSGLTITLTSADTAVCTVSGLNVIQVTPGTCSITASQAGDANYLAATSVTKAFTIAKAAQTITFTGSTKQKPAGDFTLAATTTSGLAISYASTTVSVCTVSGSTVTPVTLGTCAITASQAGDSNYLAATSVNASFTIESVPVQTTSIGIISAANYRFGIAITATAGTWTGTATVTISRAWYRCDIAPSISAGTGTATALKPADCTAISGATGTSYTPVAADVTKFLAVAETASNTTSTGANSRTTFVSTATAVEKQTQTITFGALSNATYGDSAISLTASSDRSLTISYVSSNTAVCTVSGTTLTVVAPGTCDVTASQAGDSNTLAATSVTRTLTVVKANQTVSLNNLAAIDFRGTPTALVYSATSGLSVTTASNNTSICTVSGTTVSVVAVGTCSITVSQAGNSNYNAATSVTKTFVISKAQDTLTFSGATKQFRSGNFTISASTLSGASVSFTSTTTSICTVSGTTVTPVTHGACVITATAAADSNYLTPANVNATFTIERAVEQTAVHAMTAFATYWFDQQISYTAGTWVGSGTVTVSRKWYSCTSAPTVGVVSGNAVPAGCTLVTETSTGAYKPVAADIGKYVAIAETASNVANSVTNTSTSWIVSSSVVTKLSQTLTFAALTDKTYGNLPFVLTGSSSQSLPITYTSSDSTVCSVSGATVSIVSGGSCEITASQAGNTTVAAATSITQTLTVNKASQTINFATLADVTYSAATVSIAPSASSALGVIVASDDTSVCAMNGTTVTLLKSGTCSITASQTGNGNYSAAPSVTRTFQIAKASQTVTFSVPEFLSLGAENAVTLNGTSSVGLDVSYTVTNTAICDVQNGQLVGNLPGSCAVTATQVGDDRYLPASVVRTAMVANYAVVQSIVPSGSLFTNGTSTEFTITFDGPISEFTATDLSTIPAGTCNIDNPQAVNGDLAVYSVQLTNCAIGSVVLKVAANSISNGAPGPALDYVGTEPVTFDRSFLQTVTFSPQFTSPTNDAALIYNLTFAEPVTGLDANDISVAGTGSTECLTALTGSGSNYSLTLTGCTEGSVIVGLKANSVADRAGNSGPSVAVAGATVQVDLTAPTAPSVTGLPVEFSRPSAFTASFAVVPGNTYHCTLNGVELTGCNGSLAIPLALMTAGDYTLEVWVTDAAGNDSIHDSHSWTISNFSRPTTPTFNVQGFERTSFNHLLIKWAAVTSQSSELPVTGLQLEYSTDGSTWTVIQDLAASETSYDLAMQSGSVYSFRLKALSGPFAVNASDYSTVANYTATYKPAIVSMSTSAALLKPARGSAITLTGTDLRDLSLASPNLITGTVVTVTDSAGKAVIAQITSVTPTSIRFVVPTTSKIGAATVKVTVGTGVYQSTSANRTLNIVAKKINQVITFTPPLSARFASPDVQATATLDSFSTPVFTIEPGSIGICSVSPTGLIHPLKGGACSYKISAPASDAFNAFVSPVYTTAITRLNVPLTFELPQNLRDTFINGNQIRIRPDTFALSATADANIPDTLVKISSAPETTCFVDADKLLHIVGVGTCTVTALAENDYYRTEVPVTRAFQVIKNDQLLTFVPPGTSLGLITAMEATDSSSGFQLSAFLDSGLTPNYESVNSEICSVDATGIVIWSGDLAKNPTQKCQVKISHDGDANFGPIQPLVVEFGGRHLPPLAPVGGWIREPDGALAVGRTGGLAASGGDGVAVVVVSGNKITITPFSKGMYIGPITATVTIPYYVPVKNVMTLKTQVCTVKWGVLKKMKASDPTAFKVKKFGNTKSCAANKDAVAYFAQGNRLLPTIVVKRDRRWPTTYLSKMGSNGKGQKIYPAVKTWHLTIG